MELSTTWFEALIKIQEIESIILKENKEILKLEKEKKIIYDEFNNISEQLKSLENELKQLIITKKENENILIETEEEIKKHQAKLNQVKKEEAYKALNIEIENAKKRKDEIETSIILLIEEIENKNIEISKKKKELEQKRIIKEETNKKIETEIKKIKDKLSAMEKEKIEIENTISDINLKNKVKELLKNKEGLAIVKANIIENNKKIDYYCGGCNIKLNVSDVNSIKKPNTFVICQNCSRMIYLK